MNGQIFPLFENTHVLRTPMLTELRDYAYEYGKLTHEDYSDGILSGCKITTTKDTITLNRGIIRYKTNMYLITEPISLEYYPTEIYTIFKLEFKDEIRRDGYIYREVEVGLTDRLTLHKEELELCRFKLKSGSRLRIDYLDFEDRNTEFDTVNRIYVPYAAYEKSSISPDITRAFAQEAINYNTEPLDLFFCMQAFNAKTALNRDTIIAYISNRLKKNFSEYDNLEIFESFRLILNELKENGIREISMSRRKKRQIIVD